MITVELHEAESRFAELIHAVEEDGETVLICRKGVPVTTLRRVGGRSGRNLQSDPSLRVTFAADYDPAEPLRPAELPPNVDERAATGTGRRSSVLAPGESLRQ